MYITVTQQQLLALGEKSEFLSYKLCYIDEIDETYSDYTPESKKIMESDEYKKWYQKYNEYRDKELSETGHFTYKWDECPWYNDIQMEEYPNPEREMGTHYAYFTPLSLDEQWGDDWDDAPYECNAGCPYDEVTVETKEVNGLKVAAKRKEYNIIKVPFTVCGDCVFPSEYGYNLPFCVKDINNKAIAWMYNGKKAIHAGINPFDFIKEIKDF